MPRGWLTQRHGRAGQYVMFGKSATQLRGHVALGDVPPDGLLRSFEAAGGGARREGAPAALGQVDAAADAAACADEVGDVGRVVDRACAERERSPAHGVGDVVVLAVRAAVLEP